MTSRPEELSLLFSDARTHFAWLDQPIDDALLERIYDLAKMAPTGANAQPLRVVYVRSAEAKERLRPALDPMNVDKTMSAPVTAILAADERFYDKMPELFPARPELRDRLAGIPEPIRERMNLQNTNLQAGYFILAARALGLDVGPMGGFDRTKVDDAFLDGTSWRSVLLVNLGHGDPTKLYPRNPRLSFADAGRIL